jgi:hypothetical protein
MGAFSCSVLYYTAGRRPGQLLRLAPATATPPRRVAHGGDDGWGWWRVRANDGRRRAGGNRVVRWWELEWTSGVSGWLAGGVVAARVRGGVALRAWLVGDGGANAAGPGSVRFILF